MNLNRMLNKISMQLIQPEKPCRALSGHTAYRLLESCKLKIFFLFSRLGHKIKRIYEYDYRSK